MFTRRALIGAGAAAVPLIVAPPLARADVIHTVAEMNLDFFQGVWPGGAYADPSPYTSHTFNVDGTVGSKTAAYATWRLIWSAPAPTPPEETGIIRLFTRTPDTSGPKVPIAYIHSSSMLNPGSNNVSNDAVNVTTAFNAFLAEDDYGHFGWDIAGNNSATLKFWASRLEIGWNV